MPFWISWHFKTKRSLSVIVNTSCHTFAQLSFDSGNNNYRIIVRVSATLLRVTWDMTVEHGKVCRSIEVPLSFNTLWANQSGHRQNCVGDSSKYSWSLKNQVQCKMDVFVRSLTHSWKGSCNCINRFRTCKKSALKPFVLTYWCLGNADSSSS